MFTLRLRSCQAVLHRGMSTISRAPLLVTPSQVAGLPSRPTVFVDASWVMPTSTRNPKEEFQAYRIPGAQYLDIDEVANNTQLGAELGLKHMMPEPTTFAQACEHLGISRGSYVVLYDTQGCFSSPRALFMFRAFSHDNSSVLNGGLPRWIDEGFPVETGLSSATEPESKENQAVRPSSVKHSGDSPGASYPVPIFNDKVIRSYEQMVANACLPRSDAVSELVLDARSRGRYLGIDPEPRPNIQSGHIPQSLPLPFTNFVTNHKPSINSPIHSFPAHLSSGYTTFRAPEEVLQELRAVVGEDDTEQVLAGQRSVVTTCGSGMTAAILWLGLSTLWETQRRELPSIAIYDESWTGYAGRSQSRIVKGED